MHGARAAIDGGMLHIEKQVASIESAVMDNPEFAFDLAKTLVESTCKTILSDRKASFSSDDDLSKLFKAVTQTLPMLPTAASSEKEARKSLAQTLNGLHTALQGVCELRNAYGFASHGTNGPRPFMESVQALLAAQAADAIVGFLHRVHRQERVTPPNAPLEYAHNPTFNAFLDDANDVVWISGLEYSPSEVLFGVDQQAYLELLSGFESGAENADGSDEAEDTGDSTETASTDATAGHEMAGAPS
jgi:hypothetical protein